MWATTKALRTAINTRSVTAAAGRISSALFSTSAVTEQPLVLVEKVDKYAIVRMNRPPVNSLNTEVHCAIL